MKKLYTKSILALILIFSFSCEDLNEDINSNPNDILISDVDEIPNLRSINNLNEHNYTVFKQKNLSFKLNLINKTLPNWFGSRICKKKYLKRIKIRV